MSLEKELIALVNRYIAGQISFEELARWENEHTLALTEGGPHSVRAQLSGSISLTAWELREGFRPPESVHEIMVEEFAKIVGTPTKA